MKKIVYQALGALAIMVLILVIFSAVVMLFYGPRADAATIRFDKSLSYGITNSQDVKNLQAFLSAQGDYDGPISGSFYGRTFAAVRHFQGRNHLPATGTFGVLSRGVANTLLASKVEQPKPQTSAPEPVQAGTSTPTPVLVPGTNPVREVVPAQQPSTQQAVQAEVETVVTQTVVGEISSTQAPTSTPNAGVIEILKVPTCKLVGTPSGANGGGYLAIFGWTMDARATGSIDHGVGALDAADSRDSNKMTFAQQTDSVVTYTLTESLSADGYQPVTKCTVDVDITRLMKQ